MSLVRRSTRMAALSAQIAASGGDTAGVIYRGDAGVLYDRDVRYSQVREGTPHSLKSTIDRVAKLRQALQEGSAASLQAPTESTAKDRMVSLKAALLDTISLLQSNYEDMETRIGAAHRGVLGCIDESLAQLRKFDDEFVHLDTVGYDIEYLIREAGLCHSMEGLREMGLPIRLPDAALVSAHLERVLAFELSPSELIDLVVDLKRDVADPYFGRDDGDISSMIASINTFTLKDPLAGARVDLRRSGERTAQLLAAIRDVENSIHAAVEAERLHEAEALRQKYVDARGELCTHLASSLGWLCAGDTTSGGLLTRLDNIMNNASMSRLTERKVDDRDKARNDIRLLDQHQVVMKQQDESATFRYKSAVDQSVRRLCTNRIAQDGVWSEIEVLLQRAMKLQEEQRAIVGEHTAMTEEEQRRRQRFREYVSSYRTHRRTLEDLIANCNGAVDFIEETKRLVARARKLLEAQGVEAELKRLLGTAFEAYRNAFAAFGDACVDIDIACEKRMCGQQQQKLAADFVVSDFRDHNSSMYSRHSHVLDGAMRKAKKVQTSICALLEQREEEYVKWCVAYDVAMRIEHDNDVHHGVIPAYRERRAREMDAYLDALGFVAKRDVESADAQRALLKGVVDSLSVLRERLSPSLQRPPPTPDGPPDTVAQAAD